MAYIYNGQTYNTQAELESAVTAFKSRLDNNPTDWVQVSLLSGSEADGWVVPDTPLTDAEINSMSASIFYSVSDLVSGGSFICLNGTEATAKVAELRTPYAQGHSANTVYETYAPTNEDMSGYV